MLIRCECRSYGQHGVKFIHNRLGSLIQGLYKLPNKFFTGSYALKLACMVRARVVVIALLVAVILSISPCAVRSEEPPALTPGGAGKIDATGGINLSGEANPLAIDQADLERQAEDAAAKAEAEQAKRDDEHNLRSYKRASGGLLPLSPDQIHDFMRKLENTQDASQFPSTGSPKGEVKVLALALDPGTQPPQINLAAGYVTTIDMVDVTGEPWPILDVGVGGNFEVIPTAAGSHVVRVSPLTRLGGGNLSILLKGLPTPVIFRLVAGGETFHMRYDVRIPKMGPNAKPPLFAKGRNTPVAGDEVLVMMLENAPPKEAVRMKIAGVDSRTMAWQLGGRTFVRTPHTLLSPAWNASASSPDGLSVYEIGDAPVLLMSDAGIMVRARVLRGDDNDK